MHSKLPVLLDNKLQSYLILSCFSSVEDLKSKFCSTVANDIMLVSTLGVIRMWADEASRKSRFRILFTTYQERKMLLIPPLTHRLLFTVMQHDSPNERNVINQTTTP